MRYLDNFSLLDTPKTTGQMDLTWLRARYNVYGSPDARIQAFNSRNTLYAPTRNSTNVSSWLITKPIPAAYSRYVCGVRLNFSNVAYPSSGTNSIGIVSKTGPTSFGEVLGFRWTASQTANLYSLVMNYRDQAGVAQTITTSVQTTDREAYIDFVFDKVSDVNEYSSLIVNLNNSPVFYDKAFCNYGTNLEFVVAGMLPFQETVGSPFFAEFNQGDLQPQNFAQGVTDFYMTDGGKRFGNPVINSAAVTSVTSPLTSNVPLSQVFGGVPNVDEFATGTGLSDVGFDLNTGSSAQVAVAVQSNVGAAANVTLNGEVTPVTKRKYLTKEVAIADNAQVTI